MPKVVWYGDTTKSQRYFLYYLMLVGCDVLLFHPSPERFQAIQRIHMVNQKEKGLSVNRFAAFLDGEQLIPKHPDPAMHRHLRKALIEVLQLFQSFHEKDDEWKQIIKKPLPERTPYEKNSHLTISRLAGRILGTPHDETDYYIYLHELYASGDVHVLSETLDKTI
ncbi:hypothetical protein DT075_37855 [Bacillus licheniformis]|nr:hypothetical protein DT075_37855 [Bacillus licheniformis]